MPIPKNPGVQLIAQTDEYFVRDGRAFRTQHINTVHTNTNYWYMLLRTGSNETSHVKIKSAATGIAISEIFEGGTCSADGTALTLNNMNRLSSNTMSLASSYNPTVVSTGTSLGQTLIPGSSGKFAIGGGHSGEFEWRLKRSETYLISMQNIAGDTIQSQIIVEAKKVGLG